MENKRNVQVSQEQIDEQKRILQNIAQINAQKGKQPKAFLVTYGCQQNNNDTERIRGMLFDAGYSFTENKADADFILYNTCAVRENAEMRVFGNLGALKILKRKKPALIIAVCGCMMQQEHIAKQIRQKYKHVDIIFGTHALYKFPSMLQAALDTNRTLMVSDVENSDGCIAEDLPIKREDGIKAWVSIMYGCNNFCSYCIVPYVRGRERSRKSDDIINEITALTKAGYKEITLLGQNVNSYGKDLDSGIDFADLLRMVNDIEGIHRIRFMTSHPKDLSDKLIDAMASCKHVCPHLHLPIQSGSNDILKRMNRKYTREEYLQKIEKAKRSIPGLAVTTDIIVGFPNETDADFEDTLNVLKQVEYDTIFSFIYSKRNGTPAATMPDPITDEQKHERFARMIEVQNEISLKLNSAMVGSVQEVLVEGKSKTNPNILTGRTDTNKIVNFEGDAALEGKFIDVLITEAKTWSLNGEIMK